jgi:hypothetical protein
MSVGCPARARARLKWEATIRMADVARRLAAEEGARNGSSPP